MTSLVGVDFASSPKKTWAAFGEVSNAGRLRINEVRGGLEDKDLVAVSKEGHRVIAIDAPFGWPDRFVSFVSDHHQGKRPRVVESDDFQLRVTDRLIRPALVNVTQVMRVTPPAAPPSPPESSRTPIGRPASPQAKHGSTCELKLPEQIDLVVEPSDIGFQPRQI